MSERERVRLPLVDAATALPAWSTLDGDGAWHRFDVDGAPFVLVADGSRIYAVEPNLAELLDQHAGRADLLGALGVPAMRAGLERAPRSMGLRSLSLAVAQKCNLGCGYCYAEGGDSGEAPRNMPRETAIAAVEHLLYAVPPGERAHLSFLGGEPFANRDVLFAATEHAAGLAARRGVQLGLSVTTNGTLLRDSDAQLLERYGFAVTVSLDGVGADHDRLRPFKDGRGSFDTIVERVLPLIERQRRMQVSARVTVTPTNLALRETLDALIELGFHSVGFSRMLASPNGQGQMRSVDLAVMLEQMVACGEVFEQRVIEGVRYPFSNMTAAMQELHRGTHRPYPCGAGAGYFGVSAEGDLYPCHRMVQDVSVGMGDLVHGVDAGAQEAWLRDRHVHRQEPCSTCWARYLCGGGCHHEVLRRGRPACDFIRGWLDYCLKAYVRLSSRRPDFFGG